jgi:hypothetical protein
VETLGIKTCLTMQVNKLYTDLSYGKPNGGLKEKLLKLKITTLGFRFVSVPKLKL